MQFYVVMPQIENEIIAVYPEVSPEDIVNGGSVNEAKQLSYERSRFRFLEIVKKRIEIEKQYKDSFKKLSNSVQNEEAVKSLKMIQEMTEIMELHLKVLQENLEIKDEKWYDFNQG